MFDVWCLSGRLLQRYENSTIPPNHSYPFSPLSGHLRTSADIGGHPRTFGARKVLSLHCDSGRCLIYDVWCLMYYPEGNHTSSIKHHKSSIINQASYIKHHQSYIINHTSNINRHEKRTLAKNPQHRHHHPDCNRNYLRGNIVHVAILKHNPKTQPATRNFATFAISHFRVLSPVGLWHINEFL